MQILQFKLKYQSNRNLSYLVFPSKLKVTEDALGFKLFLKIIRMILLICEEKGMIPKSGEYFFKHFTIF